MKFKKILFISAITVIAGCESMADLAGYNSQALNLKAAQSYNTLLSEAQSENALDTRSPTAPTTSKKRTAPVNTWKSPKTNTAPTS